MAETQWAQASTEGRGQNVNQQLESEYGLLDNHSGAGMSRRSVLKLVGAGMAAVGVLSATNRNARAASSLRWDKTFPQGDKVTHQTEITDQTLGVGINLFDTADVCGAKVPGCALNEIWQRVGGEVPKT